MVDVEVLAPDASGQDVGLLPICWPGVDWAEPAVRLPDGWGWGGIPLLEGCPHCSHRWLCTGFSRARILQGQRSRPGSLRHEPEQPRRRARRGSRRGRSASCEPIAALGRGADRRILLLGWHRRRLVGCATALDAKQFARRRVPSLRVWPCGTRPYPLPGFQRCRSPCSSHY